MSLAQTGITTNVGTAIGRDGEKALAECPIAVLKTVIFQRVSFAETAAEGNPSQLPGRK
jgi:hypothetical protein